MACGAAIGVGMIIPGVSGGTIAVILNIYEKIIDSLNNLRKRFKESFLFLLPVALGAVAAFAAAFFPLKAALERAPFPTVMLFAGLMAGTFPDLLKNCRTFGFKKSNIPSVILPAAVIFGICVLQNFVAAGDANLGADMPVWGYFALPGVAMIASCALVVPGVSGSMILMILGYYQPLLGLISAIFTDFGHSALALGLFALGLVVGFFSIAKLMKILLDKFPRGTHWAILSFVGASIPAILIVFDYSAPLDAVQISVGIILALAGGIGSYALTAFAANKKDNGENAAE